MNKLQLIDADTLYYKPLALSLIHISGMLLTGTLEPHLAEIGESAQAMFDRLVEQMKKAEGVTEQLKAENQMEWVGRMNSIRSRAEEVVFSELVYC